MISNTAQNRPAFGAAYPRVKSKLAGEMIQGRELSAKKELNILQTLTSEAKEKWRFLKTEQKQGESYYHFEKENGDTLELQPNEKFHLPIANIKTADENEELSIRTGAQYTGSKEVKNCFNNMKEAFMALAPQKPIEKSEHFGHII